VTNKQWSATDVAFKQFLCQFAVETYWLSQYLAILEFWNIELYGNGGWLLLLLFKAPAQDSKSIKLYKW